LYDDPWASLVAKAARQRNQERGPKYREATASERRRPRSAARVRGGCQYVQRGTVWILWSNKDTDTQLVRLRGSVWILWSNKDTQLVHIRGSVWIL